MLRFNIGQIEATAIPELVKPAVDPRAFLPELPADAIERCSEWLTPSFFDSASRQLILANRGWLLRTPRSNILIEACNGNGKDRPGFPRGHRLDTPWLASLKKAGCAPEDIDYVLCSHLHVDHIGWFTRLIGERWVPTFVRARYLVDRVEYHNWHPATRTLPPLAINANCFEDSVTPVMEAGRMTLIEAGLQVEEGITIMPARGHTLGHVAVRVESGGQSAIFSGDAMHTPLQIVYPHCATYACEDKPAAIATHHALLHECDEYRRFLIPTHFPDPYAVVRIRRKGERYLFSDMQGNIPPGLA
jgi:glyoxylase-like metal-dependent hydrolase (beta-lactamase superfamily II)